jgi:hypothetical protein
MVAGVYHLRHFLQISVHGCRVSSPKLHPYGIGSVVPCGTSRPLPFYQCYHPSITLGSRFVVVASRTDHKAISIALGPNVRFTIRLVSFNGSSPTLSVPACFPLIVFPGITRVTNYCDGFVLVETTIVICL